MLPKPLPVSWWEGNVPQWPHPPDSIMLSDLIRSWNCLLYSIACRNLLINSLLLIFSTLNRSLDISVNWLNNFREIVIFLLSVCSLLLSPIGIFLHVSGRGKQGVCIFGGNISSATMLLFGASKLFSSAATPRRRIAAVPLVRMSGKRKACKLEVSLHV